MIGVEQIKQKLIVLTKFMGVSLTAWLIDFTIYNILAHLCNINIDISNMISSLIGVTIVFVFSNRKIFLSDDENKISINAKYAIYVAYQIILILSVSKLLLVMKDLLISTDINLIIKYANVLVKIAVAPFTFLLNYNVMKILIEKL